MATGTLYLRPSADVSLGHPVYPTTLGAGYLTINEEVSDDTATYIGVYLDADATFSYTSVFQMSLSTDVAKIKRVNSAKIFVGYFLGNKDVNESTGVNGDHLKCTLTVNNQSVFSGVTTQQKPSTGTGDTGTYYRDIYTGGTNIKLSSNDSFLYYELSDFVTVINNSITNNNNYDFSDILISITNASDTNGDSKSPNYSCTTQAYIELDCEYIPHISLKQNGTWNAPIKSYKKENGTWKKIAFGECKNYLDSNLVIDKCSYRGHVETPIADVSATCTETGMTGGIYCSYCGNTIKEHDTVIPALGHDFNQYTGKCIRCTTYHENSFTFTIQRNTSTSASTYHAMNGLTWGEYANGIGTITDAMSVYGWSVTDNGSIMYSIDWGSYESSIFTSYSFIVDNVKSTDLIIAGQAYTATDVT